MEKKGRRHVLEHKGGSIGQQLILRRVHDHSLLESIVGQSRHHHHLLTGNCADYLLVHAYLDRLWHLLAHAW